MSRGGRQVTWLRTSFGRIGSSGGLPRVTHRGVCVALKICIVICIALILSACARSDSDVRRLADEQIATALASRATVTPAPTVTPVPTATASPTRDIRATIQASVGEAISEIRNELQSPRAFHCQEAEARRAETQRELEVKNWRPEPKTIGRVTVVLRSSQVAVLQQERRERLEDDLNKAESEIERFC